MKAIIIDDNKEFLEHLKKRNFEIINSMESDEIEIINQCNVYMNKCQVLYINISLKNSVDNKRFDYNAIPIIEKLLFERNDIEIILLSFEKIIKIKENGKLKNILNFDCTKICNYIDFIKNNI